jgi:hypothetical protein
MPANPIEISYEQSGLDFFLAKSMACERVKETKEDPMLLAWFNSSTGKYSPDIVCRNTEKPSWLMHAAPPVRRRDDRRKQRRVRIHLPPSFIKETVA